MNGSSYEEYKKDLSRSQKRHSALHDGKIQLVLGICINPVFSSGFLDYHRQASLIHEKGETVLGGPSFFVSG